MADDDIVQAAVHTWQQGHPISDGQARVIASRWHGGQTSALYALTSSGAILLDDVRDEITREINAMADTTMPEESGLEALLGYVERHSARRPVEGWSRLWG